MGEDLCSQLSEAKRAGAHGDVEIVALIALESRASGAQVHGTGGAKVACGLENLALLSVINRYFAYVVEREAPQVDLTILGIAKLNAVVEHAQVIGTHRADVDGLDAAHAAIVLDLHAGKVADGVGHAVTVESLKLLAVKGLCRNDLAVVLLGKHGDIAQVLH